MGIQYLHNTEINIKAWDNCITGAINGSLHACSWYLNLVCERWDALVEDDYKSVMPLIIKRRWGHEFIDLPLLSHELGIFSGEPITAAKTGDFISHIPPRFDYYRILLNKYNPFEPDHTPFVIRKKFELDLIKPYYRLAENFNPILRSKLNLAMTRGYKLARGLKSDDLIRFLKLNDIRLNKALSDNNYGLLRRIVERLILYKSGEIYGIFDVQKNLASVGLFSWFISRLYLQFIVTAPNQAQDFPNLFLLDRFIEKYAETNSTLSLGYPLNDQDPGDYAGFAASEGHLLEITRNKLPFFFKWLHLT